MLTYAIMKSRICFPVVPVEAQHFSGRKKPINEEDDNNLVGSQNENVKKNETKTIMNHNPMIQRFDVDAQLAMPGCSVI